MRWLTLAVEITEVRVAAASSVPCFLKKAAAARADGRRQRVAAAGRARYSPHIRSGRGFSTVAAVYQETVQ
jgi:hypothetical protein